MDKLWPMIVREARDRAQRETRIAPFLRQAIFSFASWRDAYREWLANRLEGPGYPRPILREVVAEPIELDPVIGQAAAADLRAVRERDPACTALYVPFLFYKGYHALQLHRIAHWHWWHHHQATAYMLQHRCAEVLSVDIHPAARIGSGILLDHATGFVAGETAVIEDGVSLLHGITLGGRGQEGGDRHPKVRRGASIGAGAMILGNVEVGPEAKIGAGSIVLKSVPSCATAVGVSARVTSSSRTAHSGPVLCMPQPEIAPALGPAALAQLPQPA